MPEAEHPVQRYIDGVLDGTIPVCRWTHLAVERQVRDLQDAGDHGFYFDEFAAQHVLDFCSFLHHSKGEWAGQPLVLEGWQQFTLWVIFGWKRKSDGQRRFRTSYKEVPRKNGKSTEAAAVGLDLMVADGEPGAEVYSAATKRDQARITHGEATRMVKASPTLLRRIGVFKDNLNVPATNSKFEPLGADEDSLDGLNIHGAIIDELHAHRTRKVVDVIETATGARRQPLLFEITTAGFNQTSVCYEHHRYTQQVLEGTVQDDSWFGIIYTIDEGDDWRDEEAWKKANPNLGVSKKIDYMRQQAAKAERMPGALNAFLTKDLDVWTQQADRWIDIDLWDENAGKFDIEEWKKRPVYGGLDLASVSDLIAWVMVCPRLDDPDEVEVLCRFWCPEARLFDEDNRYADQYRAWKAAGFLLTTEGNAVDYGFVRTQIVADAETFNLVDLNVDRLFQGGQLAGELIDEGLTVIGLGQGFLSMAAPMKEFERRLLGKKVHHGGNPVLRWMAGNVSVKQDAAGNLKPDKATSQGKIDGIVALVMALDRAIRHSGQGKSVYEERGLAST
jgi:phage terminase large subunit-like protein